MLIPLIDIVLLILLVVTAVAVLRVRRMFASVILFAIFSLLSASLFLTLDAVDVALTEAAVGAGISTILLLGALSLTGATGESSRARPLWPLVMVVITGAALIYGTLDMPDLGDPNSPVHTHVAPRYIHDSPHEIGIPNAVTSVLASYRGFDTLGEVVVIFAAGVAVLALMGHRRRPRRSGTGRRE